MAKRLSKKTEASWCDVSKYRSEQELCEKLVKIYTEGQD